MFASLPRPKTRRPQASASCAASSQASSFRGTRGLRDHYPLSRLANLLLRGFFERLSPRLIIIDHENVDRTVLAAMTTSSAQQRFGVERLDNIVRVPERKSQVSLRVHGYENDRNMPIDKSISFRKSRQVPGHVAGAAKRQSPGPASDKGPCPSTRGAQKSPGLIAHGG